MTTSKDRPRGAAQDDDDLRRAQRRFDAAINSISDGFYALDADWRFSVFNAAAEEYFGIRAATIIGRNIWDIFPQGRGTPFEDACKRAKEKGETSKLAIRSAMRPERLVELRIAPWDDGICVAISDVTGREEALSRLRDNEERLRLATDDAGVGTYDVDLSTGDGVWSARAFALLGLPPSADGRASFSVWRDRIHPDDLARVEEEHGEAASETRPWRIEYRIVRADTGEVRWLEALGRFLRREDGGVRSLGVVADVTERRQAEEALAETARSIARERERLTLALLTGQLGVYEWVIDEDRVWWAPETYPVYGVTPETFTPTREALNALIHPDDREELWRKTQECIARREVFQHEYRIIRPDGAIRWIANRSHVGFNEQGEVDRITGIAGDVTERKQRESALRESEARLRAFYESSPLYMGVTEPSKDDVLHLYDNPATAKLFGTSATENKWAIADLGGDPDVIGIWLNHYRQSEQSNTPVQFEYDFRVQGETRWLSVTVCPIGPAPSGRMRFCYVAEDITQRRTTEERTQALMREVNHRSKNMLALVQAVARQTAATSPTDFLARFEQRIAALARSQDLLVSNDWSHVGLHELIRSQLGHFKELIGERIFLSGPPVPLAPSAAQSLGMAFHELATNAAKYGALGDVGAVEISWRVSAENGRERFELDWVEQDGPLVHPPTRTGFGSKVIDQMLARALRCDVETQFRRTGLVWRMACDVASLRGESPVVPRPPVHEPARSDGRPTILILEDDPILGADLAIALQQAGFDVLGPAATNAEASALLAGRRCDGAVLDVNLGGETSAPIAAKLTKEGVPVVTLTGYARHQLPPPFAATLVLSKPVQWRVLTHAVAEAVSTAKSAG